MKNRNTSVIATYLLLPGLCKAALIVFLVGSTLGLALLGAMLHVMSGG